jgi:hypothetical protein
MLADGGSIVLFAANGNLLLTREAKSTQTSLSDDKKTEGFAF